MSYDWSQWSYAQVKLGERLLSVAGSISQLFNCKIQHRFELDLLQEQNISITLSLNISTAFPHCSLFRVSVKIYFTWSEMSAFAQNLILKHLARIAIVQQLWMAQQ